VKKRPAEAGLFVLIRISIPIAVMVMAAAAAIIFVPPAMILPIGIAQIQRARIGQSADCAACQCADGGTCSGRARCGADDGACACADRRA
jgi:hypothetical protein